MEDIYKLVFTARKKTRVTTFSQTIAVGRNVSFEAVLDEANKEYGRRLKWLQDKGMADEQVVCVVRKQTWKIFWKKIDEFTFHPSLPSGF